MIDVIYRNGEKGKYILSRDDHISFICKRFQRIKRISGSKLEIDQVVKMISDKLPTEIVERNDGSGWNILIDPNNETTSSVRDDAYRDTVARIARFKEQMRAQTDQ